MSPLEIERELFRALLFTVPGFHAIAFVMRATRFSKHVKEVIRTFFEFFGNGVEKFAFIIFTYTKSQRELTSFFDIPSSHQRCESDCCADLNLKSRINKAEVRMDLVKFVNECGGNIMIIDNGDPNIKHKQAEAIWKEVERIQQFTKKEHFRNAHFIAAKHIIRLKALWFSEPSAVERTSARKAIEFKQNKSTDEVMDPSESSDQEEVVTTLFTQFKERMRISDDIKTRRKGVDMKTLENKLDYETIKQEFESTLKGSDIPEENTREKDARKTPKQESEDTVSDMSFIDYIIKLVKSCVRYLAFWRKRST